jgi:methionyl-tRNA formyltransferase
MPQVLNIAFAGTPELAAKILESIINNSHHNILRIYTQPDRPSGRGKKIQMSPVKDLALSHNLIIDQPESSAELDTTNELSNLDVLVVAAYGLILSDDIICRPRFGCINIHTSLLPHWRGAAPIQHSILSGDTETGITIMQMDSGLDTGDIILQKACPINKNDTSGILHDKLAKLGGECILHTLDSLMINKIQPIPQDNRLATYASKIHKHDARVDWSKTAVEIDRLIRAMNPAPIAYFNLNNTIIRIWEAEIVENISRTMHPGDIVDYSANGVDIATADKTIRILKLQLPGKKVLTSRDFYNGNPFFFSINADN